ncbi:MAG: hypothetical protein ACW99G_23260 [Candidatus Thorarchaeota archaeon]|jgi:hypothetical protein
MEMSDFIEANYFDIDSYVEATYGVWPSTDEDRENFVMNDEYLYEQAVSSGVDV